MGGWVNIRIINPAINIHNSHQIQRCLGNDISKPQMIACYKNLSNKNQDHSPSSERSTPTPPSPGHPNTPKKIDPDLKAYLMMMVEDIKKDFNNSLKEIQANTANQVEDLKEEAQKSLKELQENTTKQAMELNKAIQDLKREVDTIKKTQGEAML
jgi:gas vesicle protein